MKLKNVIVASVLTTLVTNLLISSWIFWLLVFIAGWVYLGYLGCIAEKYQLNTFVVFGPIYLFTAILYTKSAAFYRLWEHFTSRPIPNISFQNPIKLNNEDKI